MQKGTSTYKRKDNAKSMKKTDDKEQHSRTANRAPLHYLESRADPLQIKSPSPLWYLQSSIREKTVPSLQTGKNTQPTALGTEGRFLNKGPFTREPLCEISDLLVSSELVLLLMNSVQVHEMQSSSNTFTIPHKSLHS